MPLEIRPHARKPWRAAAAWLGILGPFFFLSYGFANWMAGQRPAVPSIVFEWERAVPFLPWTIVPYWLIDVLYALSLFLCATRSQLNRHVKRLVLVQIVSVACFLGLPLRFAFDRPPVEGLFGSLFTLLEGFDRPFNQAPSLHIALLVILWPVYLKAVPKRLHVLVHAIAALIGISVLTTWQHHFIDVPTGAWLGAFALWIIGENATSGRWRRERIRDPVRRRLSAYYALGAIACGTLALVGQGGWFWLLWPAASLALVAIVYCFGAGCAYRKSARGRFTLSSWLLFGPYLLGARINALLWTRHDHGADEICAGVHLGSLVRPWRMCRDPHATIVDVAAEIPCTRVHGHYAAIPMLDLIAPTPETLAFAARAIAEANRRGPVLVACALGYSRSAAALAAWLVDARIERSAEAAVERIRRVRPRVVLGAQHMLALQTFSATRHRYDASDRGTTRAAAAIDLANASDAR